LPTPQPEKVLTLLETVFDHNAPGGLAIITEQVKTGANLEQFAYDIAETLRLVLILQTGFEPEELADYRTEHKKRLKHLYTLITPEKLIKLTDKIIVRRQEMKRSVLPQLPLELWTIEAANLDNQKNDDETPQTPSEDTSLKTKTKKETRDIPPIDPPVHKITETIKTTISNLTHPHKLPRTALETIKEKWLDLIQELDQSNHSLTFILKICTLEAITENGLEISLPYSFHKEKIDDRKNKKIIEDVLEKILGERVDVFCVVKDAQTKKAEDEAGGIAADFGGEVVKQP
jgi:DNA polymerase III gamma/tau subunit